MIAHVGARVQNAKAQSRRAAERVQVDSRQSTVDSFIAAIATAQGPRLGLSSTGMLEAGTLKTVGSIVGAGILPSLQDLSRASGDGRKYRPRRTEYSPRLCDSAFFCPGYVAVSS